MHELFTKLWIYSIRVEFMDCIHYKLIHDINITFHLTVGNKITMKN